MLIVFFAGLIIMASGSTLGNLCNIEYLSIVCNIIGGIMMGSGACYAVKYVENKRNELESRLEKMPGKEEHENNIRILSSIESLLKGHGETLAIIEQDQKKIISIVEDRSEIKNIKKIIEDENSIINDALERLKKDNIDSLTRIGDSLSDLINKSVGFSDKLTQLSELIQKENTDIVESLQSIDQRAIGISVLPQEISESIDTLIVLSGTLNESSIFTLNEAA
ncbi:hypothetical protein [Butyrivibrio sp. LC3010]|uniref:hypothetical protein n=1 Tax=Butyrivibrio sp. LC3010 TaxID=1280680 RepID=UPI000426F909|nr:hypothetical protein [Butyrivibrio sp. LC3010]